MKYFIWRILLKLRVNIITKKKLDTNSRTSAVTVKKEHVEFCTPAIFGTRHSGAVKNFPIKSSCPEFQVFEIDDAVLVGLISVHNL